MTTHAQTLTLAMATPSSRRGKNENKRKPLILFAFLLTLLVSLTLSGCVGLTGASTPTESATSNNTSSGALAANATSFSFGQVAVGSHSQQSMTFSNTGTAAVMVTQGIVTGAGFSVPGGISSVSIAAGQNHTFTIQFAPVAAGAVTGSIVISTDSSDAPMSISLSGVGMAGPSLTVQPTSQTVTAGQTATFTVIASGAAPLSYQWQKNGGPITGATASTYTTPATTSSDNGAQFTVVVTDSLGSATTSTVAALTVTAAPVAPAISTQPVSQTVIAGQTATFSVSATGTATLTYQWQKNGGPISGATSATYTTPVTTISDNGATFNVVVTNSVGSATSNAATLTVNVAPAISAQPASLTVTAGQTATFSVLATGTAPLTYQWLKNGGPISGATASTYTTPVTAISDSGTPFTVVVTNSVGSATSNVATLTVTATPVAPTISTQPVSRTVTAGQTATFSITATGTAPLTYQWQKNGGPIAGATSSTYTTPITTTSDNGALFTVVVTNSVGSATSNAATLTVNPAPVAPAISTQPVSQTVTAGQSATFSVVATGTATLTYQWQKNGGPITGATSSTYTTPGTTASDNGAAFKVVVTNSAGSATSNAATLTVNVAPAISTQPANQTIVAGQTATFSVVATGTPSPSYQWQKNGGTITGATSSTYTTPVTTTSDNGALFTVVVTNSVGSATSNAATLTVNAQTLLLNASSTLLSFGNVPMPTSSTKSVTLTSAGNSSVTISSVTLSGPGYTVSGVATGLILTPGQTATLNVTFTPSATGPFPGSVIVASTASNSAATVTLSGSGIPAHSATLAWTASTSSVSGYNVYRSGVSGGPYTKLNSSLVTTTSYTDSAILAGTTYYYVVTSVNSTNVESVLSNEVSTTIPTP